MNSRLDTLLRKLDLLSCWYVSDKNKSSIDYKQVGARYCKKKAIIDSESNV